MDGQVRLWTVEWRAVRQDLRIRKLRGDRPYFRDQEKARPQRVPGPGVPGRTQAAAKAAYHAYGVAACMLGGVSRDR